MGAKGSNESSNAGVGAAGAPVVRGRADVECRVVVRVRCPRCGRVHRHFVDSADRPWLPGAHLFRQDCGGARYLISVPERAFARARNRARAIARQHRLNDAWSGGAREAPPEQVAGPAADDKDRQDAGDAWADGKPGDLAQTAWYFMEFDAEVPVVLADGQTFIPLAALCGLLGLPLRPYIAAARRRYHTVLRWRFPRWPEWPELAILPVRRGDMSTREWCLRASLLRDWFPARMRPSEFRHVAPYWRVPLLQLCRRMAHASAAAEREQLAWHQEAALAGRDALRWCVERRTLHDRYARRCAARRARAAAGLVVPDRAVADDGLMRLLAEGDQILFDLRVAASRLQRGQVSDPGRVNLYVLQVLLAGSPDTPTWPLSPPHVWLRPHFDAYDAWLGRLRARALASGLPWPLERDEGSDVLPDPGPRPAS